MSSHHPSAFDLGKTLGSMDEHLKSIDQRLGKGDENFRTLNDKLDKGLSVIQENITELKVHKERPHLYHITQDEGRWSRVKRHKAEIGIPSGIGIAGLIFALLQYYGVI